MVAFEIYQRITSPFGQFGLRSQEFVFGWGVLLLVFVVSILLAASSQHSRKGTSALLPLDFRVDGFQF